MNISPSKGRIRAYRVLLIIGGLLFSLVIAEAVLRVVERSQLGDRAIEDKLISDPVLGKKLAPFTRGHDANGFRNDSVPQHADVVTLGDSQTWGVNAERQDDMAMGGFGPVQYQALIPQALRLSPKIIVVGFTSATTSTTPIIWLTSMTLIEIFGAVRPAI